jgi:hypothetical protein
LFPKQLHAVENGSQRLGKHKLRIRKGTVAGATDQKLSLSRIGAVHTKEVSKYAIPAVTYYYLGLLSMYWIDDNPVTD